MRVVSGPMVEWGLDRTGRAVTIGVFDGVHLGHRRVLDLLGRRAGELGLETAVVTFHPHPLALIGPDMVPPLLTGIDHRLELLEGLGVDLVAVLSFDERLRRLTAAEFAAVVLADALAARLVVVGGDFRFGYRRSGNVAALATLGDAHGFAAEVIPLVGGEEPWSSTRIRQMVAEGDMRGAALALGRPHEVRGRVVHGEGRGSGLGVPTANVEVPAGLALPPQGVYAVRAGPVGAGLIPGVADLGVRPTFNGGAEALEVHLFDYHGDLYGESMRVAFVERLRGEQRFASVGDLVAQMRADVASAQRILGS
jgi:riboflavin kinase/FMN adenylyltransferase